MKKRLWTPSLCFWPYAFTGAESKRMSVEQLCELALIYNIGFELPPLDKLAYIRSKGIKIPAILPDLETGDPAFKVGLCNSVNMSALKAYYYTMLVAHPAEKILIFTGVVPGSSKEDLRPNLVKQLVALGKSAATNNHTLVLEHLNSKGDSPDDMKGHCDYVGDDLEWLADVIREVNSPNIKLLFDQYHIDVMHPGRLLELLGANIDIIGHVHTAGVIGGMPSRVELDHPQAGDLRFFFEALTDLGYAGSVGLEYILSPDRDPEEGIRGALEIMGCLN